MQFKIFILFLVPVLLINCEKEVNSIIDGRVIGRDGGPVEGAEIHLIYNLGTIVSKRAPNIIISFDVPSAGKVLFQTKHFWTNDIVEIPINNILPVGVHTVVLTDSLYTNGIYLYDIVTETSEEQRRFLKSVSPEELIYSKPRRITDNTGTFEIDINELGIGEVFRVQNETTVGTEFRISSLFKIIAIKNGEVIAQKTLEIDEDKGNELTLIAD